MLNPTVRKRDDWQLREEHIEQLRFDTVRQLYDEGGLSLCIQVAEKTERPQILGDVLGKLDLPESEEDSFLHYYLTSQKQQHLLIASGFISGRFQTEDWEWVQRKLAKHLMSDWPPNSKAIFYLSLPFNEQTWDLLESPGETDTKDSYWSRINPGYGKGIDYERVTRNLLKQKRPQVAVDFLAMFTHGEDFMISPSLAADVLEQLLALSGEQNVNWGDIGYDVSQLMNVIRRSPEINEDRVTRLEWNFLSILERYGEGTTTLHRALSRTPNLFIEIIKLIFRSDEDEPSDVGGEDRKGNATQAWHLLNSWHICPGENDKGELDKNALWQWVTQARQELQASGRGVIGDQQIGQALAESPFGTDGAFPHEFVRDIIEELASPEIERGFETRVFNNRGVTVRLPTDGGGLERSEADRYKKYAETMGDAYPRTAAMMRRIADNYLGHAHREDISAELTQDLWR